jgi:hypothetical protein
MNKAKGIHKPRSWKYALSVRQSLAGPYSDHDPEIAADGGWSYRYYQEGVDAMSRDKYFTNRALIANSSDGVPVGVCRQIQSKPEPLYEILGLAKMVGWEDGYFVLSGLQDEQVAWFLGTMPARGVDAFDPTNINDMRQRTFAEIVRRQGQEQFRSELLRAYDARCAISGCGVRDVLEAAHIIPYKGPETNKLGNGILLRADLHTLFDLGLIAIDGRTFRVVIGSKLSGTEYSALEGKKIALPSNRNDQPSGAALDEHRRWAEV